MCAMSGTSGSSGFGSHSKEQMDNKTVRKRPKISMRTFQFLKKPRFHASLYQTILLVFKVTVTCQAGAECSCVCGCFSPPGLLSPPSSLLSRCHQPDWPASVECGCFQTGQSHPGISYERTMPAVIALFSSLPARAAVRGVECGMRLS